MQTSMPGSLDALKTGGASLGLQNWSWGVSIYVVSPTIYPLDSWKDTVQVLWGTYHIITSHVMALCLGVVWKLAKGPTTSL